MWDSFQSLRIACYLTFTYFSFHVPPFPQQIPPPPRHFVSTMKAQLEARFAVGRSMVYKVQEERRSANAKSGSPAGEESGREHCNGNQREPTATAARIDCDPGRCRAENDDSDPVEFSTGSRSGSPDHHGNRSGSKHPHLLRS